MNRIVPFIALATILAVAADANAIDFGLGLFKRKQQPQKAEATTKVKQLIATLHNDMDEKKRRAAAEELRGFDPRNAPEVIPALIGSLQRDPSPTVRIEVVDSLGKLKPVSTQAGIAMETALQSDPDAKVREAVKAALWQYHLNGYRPPTNSPFATQTSEPPLAPKTTTGFRPITNTVGKSVNYPQTAEPPLAKPKPKSAPTPTVAPPPKATDPPKTTLPLPMPTTPTIPPPSSGPPPPPPSTTPSGLPPLPMIPTIPPPGKMDS